METWIADVAGRVVWLSRDPRPAAEYGQTECVSAEHAEAFSPLAFPELRLTRADFGWESAEGRRLTASGRA